MRKTKIVATMGPSTDDPAVLYSILASGLDVARFNFSHGTHEALKIRVEALRKACAEAGRTVAYLADTKGPEVRLGLFEGGRAELKDGAQFTLTTKQVTGDSSRACVSYENLVRDVGPGDRILLDDGLIELAVESVSGADITTRVMHGGDISDRKGVNIPDIRLNMPYICEKDRADLRFIVETGFDFIAASFVRSDEDVREIREELRHIGGDSRIRIIAKIENAEGVQNIDAILAVSDGLMVARGDLGVEVALEELPALQKALIKKAYHNGKSAITATQMLESMIHNPRPTRAETSDVANAIYDGTGAIMLSGETAAGKYPAEALAVMAKIAERTERDIHYDKRFQKNSYNPEPSVTNAISHATVTTAHDLSAAAILTVTLTGTTARNVSKFRPLCPIIACTPDPVTQRQLKLAWGVTPLLTAQETDTAELFAHAVDKAEEEGLVKKGDLVVITAGIPVGHSGTTNMIKVHEVGEDTVF